jgi:hypothetical protein
VLGRKRARDVTHGLMFAVEWWDGIVCVKLGRRRDLAERGLAWVLGRAAVAPLAGHEPKLMVTS